MLLYPSPNESRYVEMCSCNSTHYQGNVELPTHSSTQNASIVEKSSRNIEECTLRVNLFTDIATHNIQSSISISGTSTKSGLISTLLELYIEIDAAISTYEACFSA